MIFNWENIYAGENATILEMLLDKKIVLFSELMEIFFPNDTEKSNGYSYLLDLIRPWELPASLWNMVVCDMFALKLPLSCFDKRYFYFWFCSIMQHYYIPNLGETKPQIYTDKILALMIREGVLPTEICRLPRLSKEIIGFSPIPNYYEIILDYNTATAKEVVNHKTWIPEHS